MKPGLAVHFVLAVSVSLGIAQAATVYSTDYSTFTAGSISGQNGWSSAVNPGIDQSIVALGGGQKAFRISNAATYTTFFDQVFGPTLYGGAGETTTGALYNAFQMTFTFESDKNSAQPGLDVRLGPSQAGDTQRQGLFRIVDSGSGLDLSFFDTDASGNFVEHMLATGLAYSNLTTVTLSTIFNDGFNNDVTTVTVNGGAPLTFGSWETYYQYYEPFNSPNFVNSVIFRPNVADPSVAGGGLLFTNIGYSEIAVPEPAPGVFIAGGLGILWWVRKRFCRQA